MPDYEVIAEDTLSSAVATIDLTSIPGTYSHLELLFTSRCDKAAITTSSSTNTVNDLTSNIWGNQRAYSINGGTIAYQDTPINGSNEFKSIRVINNNLQANQFGVTRIIMPNYASTDVDTKVLLYQTQTATTNTGTNFQGQGSGFVTLSSAITSFKIVADGGDFMAGTSYYLAGWI
jgi:hypothetical protein|tara:strand:- start:1172 stop:1699 length:528 start_codon:yes stop_codon:yes gene_type:complete